MVAFLRFWGVDSWPELLANQSDPFSDIETRQSLIAETDDTVVSEWTSVASHMGRIEGDGFELSATGKRISMKGLSVFEFSDGKVAETVVAQGSGRLGGSGDGVEITQLRASNGHAKRPREERGGLSNPVQRRLSPTAVVDLVEAYQAGASISQLAVEFGIHRTTVTVHLDRRGVPRHSEQTAWGDEILKQAAELYATGLSLADVAHQFGVDAQTVANRFRRAGVPCDPDGAGHRVSTPNNSGAEHW